MSISSLCTSAHVTALHVNNDHLFIGFGNRLEVHRLTDNSRLINRKVANDWNIHGIVSEDRGPGDTLLAVHGNRFITLFALRRDAEDPTRLSLEEESPPFNLLDWILEARLEGEKVICIVAKNRAVIYHWKRRERLQAETCPVKCILYSAHILCYDERPRGLVVMASGTVFKEIIIWSFSCQQPSEVLQRLEGHDGVIFAMHYNPVTKVLASASDDRSIRLWLLCDDHQGEGGGDNRGEAFKGKFVMKHVLYGHESRIWRVICLSSCIISVGENCNVCFWDWASGKLLAKDRGGRESSIWSLALDAREEYIYYGASDGSVTKRSVGEPLAGTDKVCNKLAQSFPKAIAFMGSPKSGERPKLLISDNEGVVSLYSSLTEMNSLLDVNLDPDFKGYSVLDVKENNRQVIFGSKSGKVIRLEISDNNTSTVFEINAHEGKIFSLFHVSQDKYLTCGPIGELKLWAQSKQVGSFILPYSRYRWATCGLLITDRVLIVGDRCGSVTSFKENTSSNYTHYHNLHGGNGVTDLKLRPKSNMAYSAGRDGNVFEFHFDPNGETLRLLRLFKQFNEIEWIGRMIFDESGLRFVVGFASTKFLVWDEGRQLTQWSVECGGGHRCWDFALDEEGLNFVYLKQSQLVWCQQKRSLNRGGEPSTELTPVTNVNLNCSAVAETTIKTNYHSNNINCCTFLLSSPSSPSSLPSSHLHFATGGEDNLVVVHSLDLSNNELLKKATLESHISSVRAITSHSLNDDSCLLVSAGGRSQIIIWKVQFIENEALVEQLVNHFLWTVDGPRRKSWRKKVVTKEPQSQTQAQTQTQIRYMAVNVVKESSVRFLIISGCSDAKVRLFLFDSQLSSLELVQTVFQGEGEGEGQGNYCLLSTWSDSLNFYSGSNDGLLCFWSLSTEGVNFEPAAQPNYQMRKSGLKPITANCSALADRQCQPLHFLEGHKLHQNGVYAIDVYPYKSGNGCLICTGGDDNSLTLSLVKVTGDEVELVTSTFEKSAHTSLVSGVCFLDEGWIVSASIDQTVKLHRYSVDAETNQLNLTLVSTNFSCIPDISALSVSRLMHPEDGTNSWLAVVCGEGFELMSIAL